MTCISDPRRRCSGVDAFRQRTFSTVCVLLTIAAMLVPAGLAGCAGSSGGRAADSAAAPVPSRETDDTGGKQIPDFPPGKFTVQLGAYQSEDGAVKVAALARSRFTKDVFTVFNDADALYKVLLGVFDTKEQARGFRDMLVRQYPDDYRDAWVSDLTR